MLLDGQGSTSWSCGPDIYQYHSGVCLHKTVLVIEVFENRLGHVTWVPPVIYPRRWKGCCESIHDEGRRFQGTFQRWGYHKLDDSRSFQYGCIKLVLSHSAKPLCCSTFVQIELGKSSPLLVQSSLPSPIFSFSISRHFVCIYDFHSLNF